MRKDTRTDEILVSHFFGREQDSLEKKKMTKALFLDEVNHRWILAQPIIHGLTFPLEHAIKPLCLTVYAHSEFNESGEIKSTVEPKNNLIYK